MWYTELLALCFDVKTSPGLMSLPLSPCGRSGKLRSSRVWLTVSRCAGASVRDELEAAAAGADFCESARALCEPVALELLALCEPVALELPAVESRGSTVLDAEALGSAVLVADT